MKLTTTERQILDVVIVQEVALDALRQARARSPHFEVRPRYCCGSPALVDADMCAHEAVDEAEAHARCLTGVYGEELKAKAENMGLKGICFARWQKGTKVFRYDLITGETYLEPKRLGWDEKDRLRTLRKHAEVFGRHTLIPSNLAELDALEVRAEIHRETV